MPKPDYTRLEFPPAPEDRPYVVVNMVASADGKTVLEGSEQGIGSKADQRLMRELRLHADVVLNGAGTLRVSGSSPRLGGPALEHQRILRGKPRYPLGAIVSRSGDLPLDTTFFTATDFEAVVFLSESAPEPRRRAVEATGRPVVVVPVGLELPAALRYLRAERAARLLLCEGGPHLNGELFAIDAVDELFLSVGPIIVGGHDVLTAVAGDHPYTRATAKHLQLLTAIPNEETDEVYLRYRVRR